MKRWLPPLTVLVIAGLILPSNLRPVYACSCDDSTVKDKVEHADLIVLGTLIGARFEGPLDEVARPVRWPNGTTTDKITAEIDIQVESYLKGNGGDEVVLGLGEGVHLFRDQAGKLDVWSDGGSNCAMFGARLGEPVSEGRYLLFLGEQQPDVYSTGTCSGSTGLDSLTEYEEVGLKDHRLARLTEYDAALGLAEGTMAAVSNGAPAPKREDSFPYPAATALAILGPLAFLAGAAFLWRPSRTSG